MVCIENSSPGFVVKFSFPGSGVRGYKVTTRDVSEVHLAIDHHLGTGHVTGNPSCPLCRLMEEEKRSHHRKPTDRTDPRD